MTISRIEAPSHRVPAKVPLMHQPIIREIVFVRVETDGGVTGYGLTGPIQRFAARELINREIAPLLLGKDPLLTERRWYDLFYPLNPRAPTGAWSSAVSAVDIALWDIKGKHLGQPVWKLLGGYSATVPAYITFGLLEYSRDQLVEAAKHFTAQGHDKLLCGCQVANAQMLLCFFFLLNHPRPKRDLLLCVARHTAVTLTRNAPLSKAPSPGISVSRVEPSGVFVSLFCLSSSCSLGCCLLLGQGCTSIFVYYLVRLL